MDNVYFFIWMSARIGVLQVLLDVSMCDQIIVALFVQCGYGLDEEEEEEGW